MFFNIVIERIFDQAVILNFVLSKILSTFHPKQSIGNMKHDLNINCGIFDFVNITIFTKLNIPQLIFKSCFILPILCLG